MKNEEVVFLDLDGVILDTESTIIQLKNKKMNLSWDEFFEQLNWSTILKDAIEIKDSIQIIKELQQNKNNIKILTKVHTLSEMQAKVNELRNRGVYLPILFVPPHIKKSQIYVPNYSFLVDDDLKNILDWNDNNGRGILFDENYHEEFETSHIPRVRSLEFLLRR